MMQRQEVFWCTCSVRPGTLPHVRHTLPGVKGSKIRTHEAKGENDRSEFNDCKASELMKAVTRIWDRTGCCLERLLSPVERTKNSRTKLHCTSATMPDDDEIYRYEALHMNYFWCMKTRSVSSGSILRCQLHTHRWKKGLWKRNPWRQDDYF